MTCDLQRMYLVDKHLSVNTNRVCVCDMDQKLSDEWIHHRNSLTSKRVVTGRVRATKVLYLSVVLQ